LTPDHRSSEPTRPIGDVAKSMFFDGLDAVAAIGRTGAPIGMVTGGDLVAVMAHQVPELKDEEPDFDAATDLSREASRP
jgi:hypothetical protein